MANENPKADLLVSEEMLNTYHTEGIKPISQKVAALQKTGCVNILPNKATSQVISGVTWSVDEYGVIDADGTATANTSVVIDTVTDAGAIVDNALYQNILHKKLKLVGCPSGGAINKFYLAFNRIDNNDSSAIDTGDGVVFDFVKTTMTGRAYITAYIYSGQTVNHIKFKPMLTFDLSATYADYQPYSMTNRELTDVVTGFSTNGWISFYKVGKVCTCRIVANDVTLASGDAVGNIPDEFLPVTDGLQIIETVSMRMFTISKNHKSITTNHSYSSANIRATQTWVCE